MNATTRAAYEARDSKLARSRQYAERQLEMIVSLRWTRAGLQLELEALELRGANARREVAFLEERARIRRRYTTSPLAAAAASRAELRAELNLKRLVTSTAAERRAIEALDARIERLRSTSL